MANRSAGCAANGCGAFSLLGLLIGVGITVYLGSIVMSDTGGHVGGTAGSPTTSAASGASGASSGRPGTGGARISVTPSTGVTDGRSVLVVADGLPGLTDVTVAECARVVGQDLGCDATTSSADTTDLDGHVEQRLVARRRLTIAGRAVDCAATGTACDVRAAPTPTSEAAVPSPIVARATLAFARPTTSTH